MTEPTAPEQLELDLDMPTYDHYVIKLAKGAVGDMEVVREHTAKSVDDAFTLIDGLRDTTAGRDNVTWQTQEVDERGLMFGLGPKGVVYEISVVPPLHEDLNERG